jgi:hypothetical protein
MNCVLRNKFDLIHNSQFTIQNYFSVDVRLRHEHDRGLILRQ